MENYIKIMSLPHSGSTLLGYLMGMHGDIASVGELAGRTNYQGYECSCGKEFVKCRFWLDVKGHMKESGYDLDLENFNIRIGQIKPFSKLDDVYNHMFKWRRINYLRDTVFDINPKRREWADRIIKKNVALSEIITKLYGRSHFFDGTKDIFRVRHLKKELKKRLKIVWLVRDGRGVINSLIKRNNFNTDRAVEALLWGERMIERAVSFYFDRDDVVMVKYEDLCKYPKKTMERIFKKFGLKGNEIINTNIHDEFHVIGNYMRKSFSGEIRLDNSWKNDLNGKQLAFLQEKIRQRNQKYGYLNSDVQLH